MERRKTEPAETNDTRPSVRLTTYVGMAWQWMALMGIVHKSEDDARHLCAMARNNQDTSEIECTIKSVILQTLHLGGLSTAGRICPTSGK